MIGLWGPNTAYGKENGIARKCHVAFAVSFDQLLATIEKLNKHGIETFGFDAIRTDLFSRSRRARPRIHQHFARSPEPQVHRPVLRLEEVDGEVRNLITA
jgi:hypothetical protein